MASEFPPDDVKALWQNQKPKEVRMSVDEIRERGEGDRKRVRKRTVGGLATCYLLIVYFVGMFFVVPNVIARFGSCVSIVACAYMAYQLHSRRGKALAGVPTGITGIRAYRAELERQRDFHCGWWFWSRFLTFVPSYLVFIGGLILANSDLATRAALWAIAAVGVGLAILAVPLNRREARRYQQRIDELDALEK